MPRTIDQLPKPSVRLTGVNGNVYSVIGAARTAALKGGWDRGEWDAFEEDLLKSEDYDAVIRKIMRHFEVD